MMHTLADKGVGAVSIVDVARAVVNIEDWVGLRHAAKQQVATASATDVAGSWLA